MRGPRLLWAPLDLPGLPASAGVRAWAADLATLDAPLEALLNALSPEERDRAAAFRFEPDRRRFIRRRWARRAILAEALGVGFERLRLGHDPRGAPRLLGPTEFAGVHLSTSSAGDVALVAVSTAAPVGLDVAAIDPALGRDAAAAAVFMSAPELAWWRAADDGQRPARFFHLWTRKEAALKALGLGLQRDPRTLGILDSAPADGGRAGAPGEAFLFATLSPAPGCAGALALALAGAAV